MGKRTLTDAERHEGVVTALSAMLTALLALRAGRDGMAMEQITAAERVLETLESDLGDPMSPAELN